MSLRLAPGTYGDRTDRLQNVISEALSMRMFSSEPTPAQERQIRRHFEDQLRALRRIGGDVSADSKIEVLRGDIDLLATYWSNGYKWRQSLGHIIGDLHARHRGSVEWLRPPVWPYGVINVFGVVLIATEEGWRQFSRIARTSRARDVCWECLCFAEEVVDALLVAELFDDRVSDVMYPILRAIRAGAIPIGFRDGAFVAVELGGPRG